MYKFVLNLFSFVIIFYCSLSVASENEPISFGNVAIGDNRMPLKVSDFNIYVNLPSQIKSKVALRKGSVQWVRVEDVLLVPRARINIFLKANAANMHLRYRGRSINLQQTGTIAYTEFYVSLFQHDKIDIYQANQKIGEIGLYAKKQADTKKTTLIDYSCSKYKIDIENLDHEFVSIGCRTKRLGTIGNEVPMVELLWTTANFRLMDKSPSPYMAILKGNKQVFARVSNHKGEVRTIKISANIPARIHRLGTAIGFGPYPFTTSFKQDEESETQIKDVPVAPAMTLYFNFTLDETTSVRGFNALVFNESVFNNAGFYFANDIAQILDKKLIITTLIGMQALYFKFDETQNTINEPIFPQGIEFNYYHPFGKKNHVFGGGLFLSPSETIDYQNLWLRYNSWEINYIYWGKEQFSAKMWGISYIIPLIKLF